MPKPKPKQISEAERAARSRTLKANPEVAEAFQVNDNFVRETVRVDSLPDPPSTETVAVAVNRGKQKQTVNLDEAVMTILREEAEEIATRFGKFGLAFPPNIQQAMIDQVYSMLALNGQGIMVGGGALVTR